MERLRTRAVILSGMDYGDADRIVSLFTEERGRLSAFARGARKSRRRFAGVLETGTLLWAQLAETRGDTFRLDAADVIDGFGALRTDLARASRAAYACELCRELCREREGNVELFRLLTGFLGALSREGAGAVAQMRFELGALALAGLMPRLDRCARCGVPAAGGELFDPEHGGILCARCAPRSAEGGTLATAAARALAELQRTDAAPALEADGRLRAQARAMLTRFVSHHLGRRLKSLDFMRDVGVEP